MFNKSYIAFATILVLASQLLLQQQLEGKNDEFSIWIIKYNKKYSSSDEQEYRRKIFEENQKYIITTNEQNNDLHLELNQFADLTSDEFIINQLYLDEEIFNFDTVPKESDINEQSEAVDWTSYAGTAKNQGQCASYVYSSLDLLEANNFILNNNSQALSKQDIIECSTSYGNQGCSGGNVENALRYVKDKGLAYEKDYPSTSTQGTCKSVTRSFHIKSYSTFSNCNDIKSALLKSTVTVTVDASNWQFYSSGILSQCGTNLNHGALLVALTNDGVWKLKNSWGTTWGEKGFIRLAAGNTCGVCSHGLQQVF